MQLYKLYFFEQNIHQSASKTGPNKTVDDEVERRVEHDHVPHHGVQEPPGAGDVVGAPPLHTLEYVRDC